MEIVKNQRVENWLPVLLACILALGCLPEASWGADRSIDAPAQMKAALAIAGIKNGIPTLGWGSWYSIASSSSMRADGKRMDDMALACAMWGLPFGTRVRVTRCDTTSSVVVTVQDRGPAKRLVAQGRLIDLTPYAFSLLARMGEGLIPVVIERLD